GRPGRGPRPRRPRWRQGKANERRTPSRVTLQHKRSGVPGTPADNTVRMSSPIPLPEPWASVRQRLRERGLRWTPQRRAVIEALAGSDGHITGAELLERCRAIDAATIPSTVYRTLDVLEELGLVQHGHGADGREEFHV